MEGKLKIFEINQKSKDIIHISYFVHLGTFIGMSFMFCWRVLKCGVPKLVRFHIGDLPMYTFFVTNPSLINMVITGVKGHETSTMILYAYP